MSVLKKGSFGTEVKSLQLRLNARLKPSPKLPIDGRFGPATEAAVVRFQTQGKLTADGIVGPRTRLVLNAPVAAPPPPNLAKFLAELGTIDDFVSYVAAQEALAKSTPALFDRADINDFFGTPSKKRYLLVKADRVGVIDFRHFFAAAAESYNSGRSRAKINRALGGSPGQAMLLGVGNEVAQCIGEAIDWKLNSCFSGEDLGSNRLGAEFGELVTVRQSMASKTPVSQLLRDYLTKLQPVAPAQVNTMKAPGRWDQAIEFLWAVGAGVSDLLIPRAY